MFSCFLQRDCCLSHKVAGLPITQHEAVLEMYVSSEYQNKHSPTRSFMMYCVGKAAHGNSPHMNSLFFWRQRLSLDLFIWISSDTCNKRNQNQLVLYRSFYPPSILQPFSFSACCAVVAIFWPNNQRLLELKETWEAIYSKLLSHPGNPVTTWLRPRSLTPFSKVCVLASPLAMDSWPSPFTSVPWFQWGQ